MKTGFQTNHLQVIILLFQGEEFLPEQNFNMSFQLNWENQDGSKRNMLDVTNQMESAQNKNNQNPCYILEFPTVSIVSLHELIPSLFLLNEKITKHMGEHMLYYDSNVGAKKNIHFVYTQFIHNSKYPFMRSVKEIKKMQLLALDQALDCFRT